MDTHPPLIASKKDSLMVTDVFQDTNDLAQFPGLQQTSCLIISKLHALLVPLSHVCKLGASAFSFFISCEMLRCSGNGEGAHIGL